MSHKRWVDWKALAMELFVVFVGLLAALQVDQWREQRQLAETETIYLRRLKADLAGYIGFLRTAGPFLEANHRAVAEVNAAFAAGKIANDDARLFENGLIYVGHLPSISRPRPAYDEMVASGVFARLPAQLQGSVSELYATQVFVDSNFAWWREQPLQLEVAVLPYVEYYSDGSPQADSPEFKAGAEGRRIRYDFAQLRGQRAIVNGFYWAEDTHSDWVEWAKKLLVLAEQADADVGRELAGRSAE